MTPVSSTMKVARIHVYGSPDVLKYEDAPRPVPAADEVLVRVRAAGVNPIDWKIRSGDLQATIPYVLPLTPGLDFSGTIETLGAGVSRFTPGAEVYGRIDLLRLGAYAQYVVARTGEVTAKPQSVDHSHAAAVPTAALTAWQALIAGAGGATAIGVTAGQRVLIQGAAGGVGSFAVQLAKWRGAHVVATARDENVAFVRALGADEVIDYQRERFDDVVAPVDAVLDLVGGDTQARSWKVLRPGGVFASTLGAPSAVEATALGARTIAVGTHMDLRQLDEIARLLDSNVLKVFVGVVLPLAQAALAHERLEAGEVQGKVVLAVE